VTSIKKTHSHSNSSSQDTLSQTHFPCEQCGADLIYSPDKQQLVCDYCGFQNIITIRHEEIKEYNFNTALQELERLKHNANNTTISIIQCPSCAAEFSLEDEFSANCPFCGTPVVTSTEHARFIQPASLLPFRITDGQAIKAFDKWVNSLWFAPSKLKKISQRDEKLTGVYLPYWTYDSNTENNYRGQQGTIYYERQTYYAYIDGHRVRKVRSIPKIRWQPVSGYVSLHFDDILIGASKTLPRNIIDHLAPWDLHHLVPYSEAYLSGFHSELYQVTVDKGFMQAKNIMNHHIDNAVRRDIGGDQQRVSSINTQHYDTTFKHLLLPVWSAAFKYHGNTYRYVINGRNGKIHGERPYSSVKIALAVIFFIIVLGVGFYFLEESGAFKQGNVYDHPSPYSNTIYY
jgi:DNA-directed RNA polymerase subunit RPC12/RpoP